MVPTVSRPGTGGDHIGSGLLPVTGGDNQVVSDGEGGGADVHVAAAQAWRRAAICSIGQVDQEVVKLRIEGACAGVWRICCYEIYN